MKKWTPEESAQVFAAATVICPALADLQPEQAKEWTSRATGLRVEFPQAMAWLNDRAVARKRGDRYLAPGDVLVGLRSCRQDQVTTNSTTLSADAARDLPYVCSWFARGDLRVPGSYGCSLVYGGPGEWPPVGLLERAYADARHRASRMVPASHGNPYAQPGDTWRKWNRPRADRIIRQHVARWHSAQTVGGAA